MKVIVTGELAALPRGGNRLRSRRGTRFLVVMEVDRW
jgi:hypothetical protein